MGEVTNQGMQSGGFDLTQFYGVFFEEARENLATMESMLVEIDVDNVTNEELNAIFRVAHSIKGGAATFGFTDVTELTHELETLLDRLRKDELKLRREMVDVLLEAGDALKGQMARYQGVTDESPETTDLVVRIKKLAAGETLSGTAPAPATSVAPAAAAEEINDGKRRLLLKVGPLKDGSVADNLSELFRDIPTLGVLEPQDGGQLSADGFRTFKVTTASPDSELLELFSFHVSREQVNLSPWNTAPSAPAAPVAEAAAAPAAPKDPNVAVQGEGYGFFVDPNTLKSKDPHVAVQGEGYGFFVDPATLKNGAPAGEAVPAAVAEAKKPEAAKPKTDKAAANIESTTLRVSVEKVDQLINLVGELVITQAMLTQQAKALDPVQYQNMLSGVSDLERNTRHLQEAVMSIRMIPMSFVFNRFPRLIRDLATKLNKDIELKTVGEATELDKGLVEKIIDPLTHLVRNSADHGVESREKRIAAGKPAAGTITLAASHQGGSILIEVRDDGGGLRRDKILGKAKERGLPGVHDGMTDHEVWQLIWEPGFSTADQITDVSGRGVGMDVVKKNITALNGTVELDSAEGYGTRVLVRLPLTLAIMDGMSIGVGEETYILPLGSVIESFQVQADMVQTVGGTGRVVKVREEYLPVVALEEVFQVPRFDYERVSEIMVIVEAEGRRVALLVDELLGQHQIVVKNLESNYKRVQDVSGATILGDGRVALIIDTASLVKRARH